MALAQSIAGLFSRFSRHFSTSPEPGENPDQWLGRHGENLAVRHLRRNRFKVLYRNYRAPRGGEVDIVCRDKASGTLVFVEVKTRRSLDYGNPSAAVNLEKQRLIARGAMAWLRMLDRDDVPFRFDIVEVVLDDSGTKLNLIRNAFQLPEPLIY